VRLTIDGAARQFVPVKAFRAEHGLPPEFGVALFEPKDFAGLGRIDGAGADLNAVRTAVLNAIPAELALRGWLGFVPTLTDVFTAQLRDINARVNLRDVEIEFAAAGFADVCNATVYALLRGDAPPFAAVYGEWLDGTARVSQRRHEYGGWQVRIVTHAYGRAGMIVAGGGATHYVADAAIGCPAEGYMAALLGDVAARIALAGR
jgi:hypothetical protein